MDEIRLKWKIPIFYLVCFLIVFLCFRKNVYAEGPAPFDQKVEFTISYGDDENKIPGAKFSLYKLGEIDENKNLVVKGNFLSYPIDIKNSNVENWNAYADTLKAYILRDKLKEDYSAETDENGECKFLMEKGIYFVLGEELIKDRLIYKTNPFFISLPEWSDESGKYLYKVLSQPKFTREEIPKEKIKIQVVKLWRDRGFEEKREKKIEIELMGNGELKAKAYLNEENNWTYSFEDLDPELSYSVIEKNVIKDKYFVEIKEEERQFIIVNQYIPPKTPKEDPPQERETPPEKERSSEEERSSEGGRLDEESSLDKEVKQKIPQTGQLWWPIYVLSALGSIFILLGLALEGEKRKES